MATVSELVGSLGASVPAPGDPAAVDPMAPEVAADEAGESEIEIGLVEEFRTAPPEDAAEALKQLIRRLMP